MATPIIYPPTQNAIQKTLGAQLLVGTTASATLSDVTGIQNKKGIMVVDRVDSNGTATASLREYITFTDVSGSTVTGLVRGLAGSTDQTHAVGAIVEFIQDALTIQAIIDGLLNVIDTTGALDTTKVVDLTTAQTLTNKTLTSPKIGTSIKDTNGNELVVLTATASAVNEVTLANGATGSGPIVSATGDDTNIDITIKPKGTGNTYVYGIDGWTPVADTWTYASASTVTVPSGAANRYSKGDKIKFVQTTTKYFYVIGVADTVLTLTGGTDYTVANAAISNVSYSKASSPTGFPQWFAFTTTYTGWSANPTSTNRFSINGNVCYVKIANTGSGTSNSANSSFTVPVTSANTTTGVFSGIAVDNSAYTTCQFEIISNSTTVTMTKGTSLGGGSWTASNGKWVFFNGFYEI